MFREYVVTPLALQPENTDTGAGEVILAELWREFERAGLIRGVYEKDWREQVAKRGSLAALKFLDSLTKCRRIVSDEERSSLPPPHSEKDWLGIAANSARRRRLFAVIAGSEAHLPTDVRVSSIRSLHRKQWWHEKSETWMFQRSREGFARFLSAPLRHANVLRFVDPYFDPTVPRYANFFQLLEPLSKRKLRPVLEIHRAVQNARAGRTRPPSLEQLVENFRTLEQTLRLWRAKLSVFFWNPLEVRERFHARRLITDLGGFSADDGFEIVPNTEITVTLLKTADAERVKQRLNPNYGGRPYEIRLGERLGAM